MSKEKTTPMEDYARMVSNQIQSRFELMNSLFGSFSEYKMDSECGYPIDITPQLYKLFYRREGIASRVVGIYPDECWRKNPEIIDTDDNEEDSPFEKAVTKLVKDHDLWSYCQRIDELSGIGRFGILLVGIDDGKQLDEPVDGIGPDGKGDGTDSPTRKILYLRPFDETLVLINQFDVDPESPRYGKPLYYSVNFIDSTQWGTVSPIGAETLTMKRIHWTRVIHVAENTGSSEIFGKPRMEPVFNRLFDLKKICGGSAEMFWKGGFPGLALEVNPDLQDVDLDKDSVDREMREYHGGLKRYLALTGISAKTMSPAIADPTPHLNLQLQVISLTIRCPLRTFLGTEQGVLAGAQDSIAWAGRLETRREKHIDSKIIRQLIDRLIAMEVLPVPNGDDGEWQYKIKWKELSGLDEGTKAAIISQKTAALAQYVGGQVDNLIPPVDYFVHIFGMSRDEAQDIIDSAEKHIGVPLDEAAAKLMDQKLNPAKALNPQPGGEEQPENDSEGEEQPEKPAKKAIPTPSPAITGQKKAKAGKILGNGENAVENEAMVSNKLLLEAVVGRTCQIIENLARLDMGDKWDSEFLKSEAAKASRSAIALNVESVESNAMSKERAIRVEMLHNEAASMLLDAGMKTAAKWHLSRARDIDERYIANVADEWTPEDADEVLLHNAFDPNQPRAKNGEWTKSGAVYGKGGTSTKYSGLVPVKLKDPKAKGSDRVWVAPFKDKLPSNDHINSIGIPPAWTGVMVNPDTKSKLLAVGIDRSGKIQPKYHSGFIDKNKGSNFAHIDVMVDTGQVDIMRLKNSSSLKSKDSVTNQHAAVFELVAATGMRPGGNGQMGEHESMGASDLTAKNVTVKGGKVSITYVPGKSRGQTKTIPIDSPKVQAMMKSLKDKAGSPKAPLFPDVNGDSFYKHVKSLNPMYKPKDLRTAKATAIAKSMAAKVHGRFNSEEAYKKWLASVVSKVQQQIPDTAKVLLTKYISPSSYAHLAPKKGKKG